AGPKGGPLPTGRCCTAAQPFVRKPRPDANKVGSVARSVYVTGLDAGGGKSTIVLGVAELLSRRVRRIGVFRPIARKAEDPIVALLRDHYGIPRNAAATGIRYDEAALMLGRGEQDAMIGLILERFHEVDRTCDAVVMVGTDFGAPDGGEGEA